jgi:GDP-mannose 6-dehydrogenase
LAKNGHKVIGVDVNQNKVDLINAGKPTIIEKDIDEIIKEQYLLKTICATTDSNKAILQSEVSIIAVGTPSTPQGHLNLKYIFHSTAQAFYSSAKIFEPLRQVAYVLLFSLLFR